MRYASEPYIQRGLYLTEDSPERRKLHEKALKYNFNSWDLDRLIFFLRKKFSRAKAV